LEDVDGDANPYLEVDGASTASTEFKVDSIPGFCPPYSYFALSSIADFEVMVREVDLWYAKFPGLSNLGRWQDLKEMQCSYDHADNGPVLGKWGVADDAICMLRVPMKCLSRIFIRWEVVLVMLWSDFARSALWVRKRTFYPGNTTSG
jgi:hypothetical protein